MLLSKVWALGGRLGVGALAGTLSMAVLVATAVAASAAPEDDGGGGSSLVPNPGPNAEIPGGSLILDILGWLKYGALAAGVAGLLIGGIAVGVGYSGANYGASAAGRRWLLGGLGAAVIAGLAHTVVVTLYEAT